MKKKRCAVCGKMVKNLKKHEVKRHPTAYPDKTAHYRKTFQSGATIKRKTEENLRKRLSKHKKGREVKK